MYVCMYVYVCMYTYIYIYIYNVATSFNSHQDNCDQDISASPEGFYLEGKFHLLHWKLKIRLLNQDGLTLAFALRSKFEWMARRLERI